MKKIALLLFGIAFIGMLSIEAQVRQVSGTVTSSEDGSPIPGVSVVVKGTTLGTITNINGIYQMEVPEDAQTLIFSFVGMTMVEKPIEGSIVDAVMEPDLIGVDEVMVVAYGTTTKKSFTGSASTIKPEKLENLQVSSVSNALQGNASGVQVISTVGQPGENATVRIRGIGSINASSSPLYVVDGVPYGGNINSINPDDIESISVLKDASATALYGSRGSNGVIMITLKKGTAGETRVNLKASYGVTAKAVDDYRTVGAEDYYKLTWEALRNKAADEGENNPGQVASNNLISTLVYNAYGVDNPIGPDGQVVSGAELMWDTDWMDAIVKNGNRQEYGLNVSGGDESTNYFMSLGYLDNEGIVPVSDFERINARLSVDKKVTDWFKSGMSVTASTSNQNYPTTAGSAYSNMIQFGRNIAPIYPIYLRDSSGDFILDENGEKIFDYGSSQDEDGRGDRPTDAYPNTNVLGTAVLDDYLNQRDNISTRMYGEIYLLPGLTWKTNFSVDYYVLSIHEYNNPDYGFARSYGGISDKVRSRRLTTNINNLLTYEKSFGLHNFDLLLGHEAYKMHFDYLSASKSAFPFGGLDELDAGAAIQNASSYEDNHRIEGYLSRVNYDYADKYYLSLSYRRDGSSRFSQDVRWGNFWSFGGSWRISEEEFMNVDWLSNLKFKASYGTLGNDALTTYYAYQGLYATGHDNLNDPGLLVDRLATPNLTWETSENTNIGIEAGLFDRINLEVEYFNKGVKDMLFARPLPNSTGISSVDENIGDLKNTGVEANISAQLLNLNDFRWSLDVNFTHYKNEITRLPQEEIISGSKKLMVGKSVYDFHIREFAGVDTETGVSKWYKDTYELDGDGNRVLDEEGEPIVTGRETTNEYSEADRYYVGSSLPDFFGGITNNFVYKGFDFSVFFYYSVGGNILDYDYGQLSHSGLRYGGSLSADMLDRWTPDNTDTDIPRLDAGDTDANSRSTRFLVDATYLRLRNVTLGYTLPANLTKRVGLERVRLYTTGDNLLTFFKHDGLDPEVNISGTTDNRYPQLKAYSFGLNVSF